MDDNTHISKLWNVLPNKLYGMPAPKKEDLQDLSNAGIKSIIQLPFTVKVEKEELEL